MGVTVWRVILGFTLTLCLALGGWALSAIADMPKEYVSKDAFESLRTENREDHKDILKAIKELIERK